MTGTIRADAVGAHAYRQRVRHVGCMAFGRSRGDRMLMRIEDVDKPRVVAGADQLMMDDLHWLGLDWDGEPMFQSQRTERYEYALECLRSQGVLYPCFCSRADIRAASAPNEGDGFMVYPGTCRPPAARPSRRGPCPFGSRRPAFHPYRHAGIGSGRKATYSA